MIQILGTMAGFALLASFVVGWNVAIARRRMGEFVVLARADGRFAFRSDFGVFEFDRAAGLLRVAGAAGERAIPLPTVATVRIRQDEVDATLAEEWLHGLDVTDFMGFRDQVRWQYVVLRLDSGEDIPVYAVGQLRRVELFATASIEWLWDKLRRRGWIPDVAGEARLVLAKVAAQVRGMREATNRMEAPAA